MSAHGIATQANLPPVNRAARDPAGARLPALTPARLGFTAALLLVLAGYLLPTERYLSPEHGLGYVLGIAGGSAMLLLLLYPLRKRFRRLGVLGTVKGWFQAHMVLGVVGPLLVLYHCNFSLGATNSNAALWAMLIVSGSGIFGRHFYTRIHHGLYGRRATCGELQAAAAALRSLPGTPLVVPGLLDALDAADARLLAWRPGPVRNLVRPLVVAARAWRERRRLRALARSALKGSSADPRTRAHVMRYIAARIEATRSVAEFESYERLFSLWHVLHLPLFAMLVVAGVVHVIAVHVY